MPPRNNQGNRDSKPATKSAAQRTMNAPNVEN